ANASSTRPLATSGTPMTMSAMTEMATVVQLAPPSEPSSQLRISRYESPCADQKMTKLVRAAASADTATPASTVRVGVTPPAALARASVTTRASSAPTNAATGKTREAPKTMTHTAPSDAPDDSPSRYGSASGLRV